MTPERTSVCAEFELPKGGFRSTLKDINIEAKDRRNLADAVMSYCERTKSLPEVRALGLVYSEEEPAVYSLAEESTKTGVLHLVTLLQHAEETNNVSVPAGVLDAERAVWEEFPGVPLDFIAIRLDALPAGNSLDERFSRYTRDSDIPAPKLFPVIDRAAV